MANKHYNKLVRQVEAKRFRLLLLATILLLVIPAFSGKGLFSTVLFVLCISFLLIQSMLIAEIQKGRKTGFKYFLVSFLIILYWLEPAGISYYWINLVRFFLLAFTIVIVTIYLLRHLKKADDVNIDVIIVSINIYLLTGIIAGSLTYLFNEIFPGAYNLPANMHDPTFMNFIYYSFITMSTVGYGDITPRIPQTQTLGYLIAITGQLYVAIIIAFLVGKLLVYAERKK